MKSRGLRNNNPLNIRQSGEQFQGEIKGKDKSFKTFSSLSYGYRAGFVILGGVREFVDIANRIDVALDQEYHAQEDGQESQRFRGPNAHTIRPGKWLIFGIREVEKLTPHHKSQDDGNKDPGTTLYPEKTALRRVSFLLRRQPVPKTSISPECQKNQDQPHYPEEADSGR